MAKAYNVLRSFEATDPISGCKHHVVPPAVVRCDLSESSSTVAFELDMTIYLVDFAIFESCCREIQGRDVDSIIDALEL